MRNRGDKYWYVKANYGGLGDWIEEHTCWAKDEQEAIEKTSRHHGITIIPWEWTVAEMKSEVE